MIRHMNEEERHRTEDRVRVLKAYHTRRRWQLLWLLIGPGILVMLGENDAPSMLSYAATGSQFGIGFFLPFVVLTFAMAFVAQEITVRLGAVSKTGHADLIYRRFGRFWGNFAMFDLLWTNVMTLITEFVGVVAGAGFFGIPSWLAVVGALTLIAVATLSRRYWRWERMTLAFALFNLVFIPVALLVHPHWAAVGHALLTWRPLPGGINNNTIILLLADIGATITPWMLFFQQGAVSDKGLATQDIRHGRWDTAIGAFLATLAALGAIVATAPLYLHHMNAAQYGAAQFAQALVPYAGHVGAALFALGVLEAGLVAAITISTSSAYAFGEVTRTAHSLNRPFHQARSFYLVLLLVAAFSGAVVLIPGFPLEYVVIIVNVVAVLTMPPAIGFLLILANDREIMGRHRNTFWLNLIGIGVGVFVSLAGILYALTVIFPHLKF
ncbi:MAG: divalent metal cation transporter [Firmicutes bacterium]|nr:divalent metal cation transporter [Bacillota bacterium]